MRHETTDLVGRPLGKHNYFDRRGLQEALVGCLNPPQRKTVSDESFALDLPCGEQPTTKLQVQPVPFSLVAQAAKICWLEGREMPQVRKVYPCQA
jgi:hypothetical protein